MRLKLGSFAPLKLNFCQMNHGKARLQQGFVGMESSVEGFHSAWSIDLMTEVGWAHTYRSSGLGVCLYEVRWEKSAEWNAKKAKDNVGVIPSTWYVVWLWKYLLHLSYNLFDFSNIFRHHPSISKEACTIPGTFSHSRLSDFWSVCKACRDESTQTVSQRAENPRYG